MQVLVITIYIGIMGFTLILTIVSQLTVFVHFIFWITADFHWRFFRWLTLTLSKQKKVN